MSATNRYKLKEGILDWGSGNRINGIIGLAIAIEPSMFVDSGSGAELSNFSSCGFYNGSSCTGSKVSDSLITVTPSASPFSFTITNLGSDEVIGGFGLPALGQNDISVSLVRSTLGESVNDLYALCRSSLVNPFSPNKPNGAAPYRLGDFRGYCHNASGGFNVYNANGAAVAHLANYTLYACATKNQEPFGICLIEIFEDGVSKGYTVKDITSALYLEAISGSLSNSGYNSVTKTIRVDVSKYIGGTFYLVSTSTVSKILRGQPAIGSLNILDIGTDARKLSYDYFLGNQTASSETVQVVITNTTRSMTFTNSHTIAADTTGVQFTGLTAAGGTNNVAGDAFTIQVRIGSGGTLYDMDASGSLILPFGA